MAEKLNRYQTYLKAGYTDEEIQSHLRPIYQQNGFTDEQINEYFEQNSSTKESKVTITDVIKDVFNTATQPIKTVTDETIKIEEPIENAISKTINPIEQTKDIANISTVTEKKQQEKVEPSLRARTKEDDNIDYEFLQKNNPESALSAEEKINIDRQGLQHDPIIENVVFPSTILSKGLMTKIGLGIFEGIQQAKNYASSQIQGKDYDLTAYENLSSLLPDNTPSVLRVTSNLAEMVADCIVAGRVEENVRRYLIRENAVRIADRMAKTGYNEEQIKTAVDGYKQEVVKRELGLRQKQGDTTDITVKGTVKAEPETKPINVDEALKQRIEIERAKIPEPPKEKIKADVEVEEIKEPKQIKPVEEVKTTEISVKQRLENKVDNPIKENEKNLPSNVGNDNFEPIKGNIYKINNSSYWIYSGQKKGELLGFINSNGNIEYLSPNNLMVDVSQNYPLNNQTDIETNTVEEAKPTETVKVTEEVKPTENYADNFKDEKSIEKFIEDNFINSKLTSTYMIFNKRKSFRYTENIANRLVKANLNNIVNNHKDNYSYLRTFLDKGAYTNGAIAIYDKKVAQELYDKQKENLIKDIIKDRGFTGKDKEKLAEAYYKDMVEDARNVNIDAVKPDLKGYKPVKLEYITEKKYDKGYSGIFDDGTFIDMKYYSLLKKKFPNAKILTNGEKKPIAFVDKDKIVAVVMPMRDSEGVLEKVKKEVEEEPKKVLKAIKELRELNKQKQELQKKGASKDEIEKKDDEIYNKYKDLQVLTYELSANEGKTESTTEYKDIQKFKKAIKTLRETPVNSDENRLKIIKAYKDMGVKLPEKRKDQTLEEYYNDNIKKGGKNVDALQKQAEQDGVVDRIRNINNIEDEYLSRVRNAEKEKLNQLLKEDVEPVKETKTIKKEEPNVATSKTDFSQQTDVELPKVTKTHDELIKKSEIIRDLAKEVDLPVKIGGTQRKNILGLYYMKEELVRLQVANDMLTLAHEIGHHEEKVLFGGVYRKFKDFTPEQKEFYKELKPLATKPAGNETRGKMFSEGLAQFISMFVNNPEQAQKVAPKFYEYFTKNAPEKTPKVYNALVKAQARMSKYYTQNSKNKVKNHISFERETEKLTPKEWFDNKLTQIRTQLFDRLEPLRKSVQEIYKRAGLKISDTDPNNPYFIARLNSGSVGRAETFIKRHTYDFNTLKKTGKGLQTIIQEVEKNGGDLETFATYLVAHDTVGLAKRGIKTGVELEDAKKTVEQLAPIYESYAKDLYEYRLSLLKMLRDGQILSQEGYNNIVNAGERYAPLQRVLDDEINTMAGSKNFKSSNPLKNIKGSGRDIINPLETIVEETYNIINLVEKNRVGLALANLSKLDRSGAFIFKRPHKIKAVNTLEGGQVLTSDKTIDKNNEIKVFENGKPVVYEVAPEIAKIVNGLTIENQILYTRWLENVATIPARALKFGATDVNLAFAFKNILRDLPLALVSSENKFSEITKSVLNMTVLGLKAMVNEKSRAEWNDIVDLYTKSGAGQSLLINDNRDSTIKAIDDLRYTGYLNKIWNKVKEKDFIEATKTGIIGTTELVRSIVGFLEQVPRLAEFVASLKGKPLTKSNIEKAGFNARKITLDFASGGSFSKYVNKYVPYTNAFFLGIDKLKEVFKDQKQFKRLLGMLGVYAMACMLGEVLDVDSEEVDDVNRTQKYTNFVFKIGDTIFRIPKTIELAPFYTTIDTAISLVADTIKGKKKENAEYIRDIVGSMKANLFPNVIAQAVKLPIELYANKSMFFGTPIVSAELEKALPEYQYTEYTTELSKFIAKTLGNIGINKGFIADTIGSPQRLEYIVNSLAGNTGKYLFEKVDQIGRLTGVLPDKEYELPEKTLADIPFVRAFVIRYPQQSRTIEDFYEKYKELKQYSNSFRLSKKRADIQAIQELAIYKSVDKVDKISKTMGDVRKTILTVYTDKNMSKDEKRQNIDELMLMRLALAKQGLNMMKEIEQNIKGEL